MKDINLKEKFCNTVADKLLEYILRENLIAVVTKAIYDKVILKRKKPQEFLRRNEKFIMKYERKLRKRYSEMEKEVLGKIKYLYEIYNKSSKDGFDVNQWLFNRQKWRGTLTADGKLLTATPLESGGQYALDDLGLEIAFDKLDPRVIEWIATNSKNAGWSITDTQYEKLRTGLMEGIADGESIPKIRKRVAEIFDASRSRATMIARTETLKASNRGNLIGMMQSGVVEGKQWLSTMDARCCPECAEMDGATMPLEEPFFKLGEEHTFETGKTMPFDYEEIQHCPLHPDCRCTLLAILKEV